jgi:hypothetical protein
VAPQGTFEGLYFFFWRWARPQNIQSTMQLDAADDVIITALQLSQEKHPLDPERRRLSLA